MFCYFANIAHSKTEAHVRWRVRRGQAAFLRPPGALRTLCLTIVRRLKKNTWVLSVFQRHWCDCKGCKRRKVFGEINIIKAHCGCTRGQQETFFHTAACLSPRTHKAIIRDPYFYLPRAVCAVCVQPLFEICLGLKVAQVVRRPKRVSAQEDNLCFMLSWGNVHLMLKWSWSYPLTFSQRYDLSLHQEVSWPLTLTYLVAPNFVNTKPLLNFWFLRFPT